MHRIASVDNRRGFTLTELVVVVTIIGATAAFALPQIDFARYQIDGAMRAVGTTLMAAQREAMSKQHDMIVQFDVPNNALIILYDRNSNGVLDAGERQKGEGLDENAVFSRANAPARAFGGAPVNFTRVVAGLPAVTFHANGSASEESGLYISSSRAVAGQAGHENDTRAVEVIRATGRAEWYSYNGSQWRRGF